MDWRIQLKYRLFLAALLFIFVSCNHPGQKKTALVQSPTINSIEQEFYTNGNLNKTFSLALGSLDAYRQKNDIKSQTEALLWMATIRRIQYNYTEGLSYLRTAAPLTKKIKNDSLLAVYNIIAGELFTQKQSVDSAFSCFAKAGKIISSLPVKNTVLTARLDIAQAVLNGHQHQPKIVDSLTLDAIKNSVNLKGRQTYFYHLALFSRAGYVNENGNPDSALALAKKNEILLASSFPENNYLHTLIYRSLAGAAVEQINYIESVKYAKKELVYADEAHDYTERFYAYYDMFEGYFYNTDYKNAISYTDSMQMVAQKAFPEKSEQFSLIYNNYGRLYTNMHDYNKAKYYLLKTIKINTAMLGEDNEDAANFYFNMGNVYSYEEKYDSLLYYYYKVLAIDKKIYPKNSIKTAFCMDDIARNYNNMDKPEKALPYQIEIEKTYIDKYGPNHSYVAWAYDSEADSYSELKQYNKALLYNDKALGLFIPNIRTDTNAINRTASIPFDIYIPDYFASRVDIYFNHFLNTKNKPEQIKLLKEGYRVGKAADKFNQSYATHFDSPESISSLYQRLFDYYRLCADISYQLYRLTGEEKYRNSFLNYAENKRGALLRSNVISSKTMQFSGVPANIITEETKIRNEVTAVSNRGVPQAKRDSANKVYETFLSKLAARYPNYYKLKYQPYQINETDVQRWLPNDSTFFIEYMASKKQLYVMIISKKKSTLLELEKKDSILSQISGLNELLKSNKVSEYYAKSYTIYGYLVKPLEPYIKPRSRLFVSADGVLSALSFEALVTKASPVNHTFNTGDFLLNKYNVTYAISAFSLLNPFKKENTNRSGDKAYYAAPGFNDKLKNDYKKFAENHQQTVDNQYLNYLYQPFMLGLGNSLSEAWNVTEKEGNDATESDFKQKAPGNNILQIGSHALLDNIDPMRSCLVFAKELSTDSTANDGYLYSSEIFDQKLNADLVILTACETGGGHFKVGEGMMSLSYSFEYAGCKSAIMSLWPIDEKTASTITKTFYKYLSTGQSTSDALYHAKKDFLKTADASLINPFYWSGLVLIGTDEKIKLQKKENSDSYKWMLGTVCLLTAGAFGLKKLKSR